MTTPSRVRACAEKLATSDGALDERIDRIDVRGTPDAVLRHALSEAAREWCEHGCGTFSALDAVGDEVAIDQLEYVEGELRLVFGKRPTETTFYCLTTQGLARLMEEPAHASRARRVLVAEDFAPFRTVGCRFEQWSEMVADVVDIERAKMPVPRRIVRDQLAIVPLSIGSILLAEPPQKESSVFTAWRAVVSPQLLSSLCDEIWREQGEVYVSLTGPRRRRIVGRLDAVELVHDFALLTDAADWIYNSGREIETRHTLFVYELAREWPDDVAFSIGFGQRAAGALDAAKTAFRMHIRDASKETLQSLQELRKTLADDVARVVTQTRELSGTMWRDLLVVVAAVLGRFTLLSSSGAVDARFADWLLWGLVAYLLFSIGMTATSNASFMKIFRDTQARWKTKLYGFIDPPDFEMLATGPLNKAESVYRRTRNIAIVAYVLTIGLLGVAALLPSQALPAQSVSGKSAAPAVPAAGTKGVPTVAAPNRMNRLAPPPGDSAAPTKPKVANP